MLKAMLPLSTAFGLLYAVPTVVQDQPRTLQTALGDTVRALEVLRGFQSETEGSFDVDTVRYVTEEPLGSPDERVARLDQLNVELQRMQAHLELLHAGALPAGAPLDLTYDRPLVPTVGLGDGELTRLVLTTKRQAIANMVGGEDSLPTVPIVGPRPTTGDASATQGPLPVDAGDVGATEVPDENSVPAPAPRDDSMSFAKARAAFFAGQYDAALAGFEAGADDARNAYWRARCLDQLGRLDEALALYDRVASDVNAGDLVERAKSDADFLRWKIGFSKKSATTPAAGEGSNR
ncbi:MAG: hypothetical protein R3F34_05290 [Planctomycetota bacterium]